MMLTVFELGILSNSTVECWLVIGQKVSIGSDSSAAARHRFILITLSSLQLQLIRSSRGLDTVIYEQL